MSDVEQLSNNVQQETPINDAKEQPDASDDKNNGTLDGVGCRKGCARDRHLCVTISVLLLIVFAVLLLAGVIEMVVFIVSYSIIGLVYLVASLKSNTFQYLRNIDTTETVLMYMDRMYATRPQVTWHIQCYHYETRTRIVHYTDSEGRSQTRTETYQERVNTHLADGQLEFTRWADISEPLNRSEIEAFQMTKISIKKSWVGDAGAEQQKNLFIQVNDRDVHYDFHEHLELDGFRPRFLGLVDIEKRPWLAHWSWYVLSHITVVLAVPYLMWMSSKTDKVRTSVDKQIWTS